MEKNNTTPEKIFKDVNYNHYIVQYQGKVEEELSKYEDVYLTIINSKYAILSILSNLDFNNIQEENSTIVYIKPADMYTLQAVAPVDAAQARVLQLTLPLSLTGNGVNLAIIDTGIDYLNEEFMDLSGKTRIECIFDQTIFESQPNKKVPFGTLYEKKQIQSAINANREGKSPYDIVPSKDKIGHGTNMTGIIGGTGKNPNLKGVVPECNFVIVKLIEDISYKKQFNVDIPVFNITSIFVALEFLYNYALESNKPMVIYFPLGTNLGNHKKPGILEQFIELICLNSSIAMVSGTGNERGNGTHTSGIVQYGKTEVVELEVDSKQNQLWVEFWIDLANIMSLEIISPSGENTGIINPLINTTISYKFIFEKTSVKINYYLPEENTGDELIRIRFYDLQPGIWKFNLTGDVILSGKYNAWIPQKGITIGETKFSLADPYGTITNPSNALGMITTAAYDQNNNNALKYSGMGFVDSYVSIIDVAAGGVNALTVGLNNKVDIVNGTSVSAAITAGACAMLFQWGIVEGNDTYMHNQTLKTYLARGTVKRKGDSYPNPQWGYGILNIPLIFENMI